jgi:hypothetical protein
MLRQLALEAVFAEAKIPVYFDDGPLSRNGRSAGGSSRCSTWSAPTCLGAR